MDTLHFDLMYQKYPWRFLHVHNRIIIRESGLSLLIFFYRFLLILVSGLSLLCVDELCVWANTVAGRTSLARQFTHSSGRASIYWQLFSSLFHPDRCRRTPCVWAQAHQRNELESSRNISPLFETAWIGHVVHSSLASLYLTRYLRSNYFSNYVPRLHSQHVRPSLPQDPLLKDDFPGGFLFYVWIQTQGEPWIQKLIRSAEKVDCSSFQN